VEADKLSPDNLWGAEEILTLAAHFGLEREAKAEEDLAPEAPSDGEAEGGGAEPDFQLQPMRRMAMINPLAVNAEWLIIRRLLPQIRDQLVSAERAGLAAKRDAESVARAAAGPAAKAAARQQRVGAVQPGSNVPDVKLPSMQKIIAAFVTNPTAQLCAPNVVKLAAINQILPFTTVQCERGFSGLKRVKTRLRSGMLEETLDHCLRITFEAPPSLLDFNIKGAVEHFFTQKKRRVGVNQR
jgi:hypothetical protein